MGQQVAEPAQAGCPGLLRFVREWSEAGRPETTIASGKGRPLDHSVDASILTGRGAFRRGLGDLRSRALRSERFAEPFSSWAPRAISRWRGLEFLFVPGGPKSAHTLSPRWRSSRRALASRQFGGGRADQAGLAAIALDRDVGRDSFRMERADGCVAETAPHLARAPRPDARREGRTQRRRFWRRSRRGKAEFFLGHPANGRLFFRPGGRTQASRRTARPCPVSV